MKCVNEKNEVDWKESSEFGVVHVPGYANAEEYDRTVNMRKKRSGTQFS
jgi:hypothetical protein